MLQPLELHSGYQKAERALAEEKATRQVNAILSISVTNRDLLLVPGHLLTELGPGLSCGLGGAEWKAEGQLLLTARRLTLSGVLGVGETLYSMDCSQPGRQTDRQESCHFLARPGPNAVSFKWAPILPKSAVSGLRFHSGLCRTDFA